MDSMHRLTIPRFSHHSYTLSAFCSVMRESFHAWRRHDEKKASSFAIKFPFSTFSVIRRKLAAQKAGTKL